MWRSPGMRGPREEAFFDGERQEKHLEEYVGGRAS
jgi:hypothetical protein